MTAVAVVVWALVLAVKVPEPERLSPPAPLRAPVQMRLPFFTTVNVLPVAMTVPVELLKSKDEPVSTVTEALPLKVTAPA